MRLAEGFVREAQQTRLTGDPMVVESIAARLAEWEAMIEAPGKEATDEYEYIRDAVIEHLNPRDGDDGEAFLMVEAIKYAAETLVAIPCSCPPDAGEPEWESSPCARCQALGRARDVRVDR
jgi:hypothetical protein